MAAPDDATVPLPMSLSFLTLAAARTVGRHMDEALAPTGLSLRHLGALGHLLRRPELSYSDLARRSGVTAQSMHATVRQLEERGAVRREHAGHGHPARLEVTAPGRRLLADATAAVARLDDELFAEVTSTRRDELRELLMELALDGAAQPPFVAGTQGRQGLPLEGQGGNEAG